MADEMQTARDDLAFLRALASGAADAPDRGGAMLAAAGAIFAIASLCFYAELTGGFDLPGNGLVWLIALAAYAVVGTAITMRLRRQGGGTARNRTTAAVWVAVGGTILAVFLVVAIAASRSGEPILYAVFAPVILALYGLGWSIAATQSSASWPPFVAVAAFGLALVLAWLIGRPEQYLAYAAALIVTALLPGLALMRRARAVAP